MGAKQMLLKKAANAPHPGTCQCENLAPRHTGSNKAFIDLLPYFTVQDRCCDGDLTVRKTLRCPACRMASLNTPTILIRLDRRVRENIPVKICRRCKIIIILDKMKLKGWRIWDGTDYIKDEGKTAL